MVRSQIYCCICGAPMLENSTLDGGESWLAGVVLLTTAHETDGGVELDAYWPQPPRSSAYALHLGPDPPEDARRRILRLEACCQEYGTFQLVASGEHVDALSIRTDQTTPAAHGGALYLPVHSLCLQLADRFIESRGATEDTFHLLHDDRISSIKQLWEVLYRRMPGAMPFPSTNELPEPHDYYGGRRCRNVYWEPADDPENGQLLETNPVEIPNLTRSILQNLEPESAIMEQGTLAQERSIEACPNLRNLDQICDYASTPDQWCDVLTNKETFPWLWDLDLSMVREKQQAGSWDWELLVRRLSLVEIYKPNDATLSLPLAMRNRRRIWHLLEEARLDDVAAPAQAARAESQRALRERLLTLPLPGPEFQPVFPTAKNEQPKS